MLDMRKGIKQDRFRTWGKGEDRSMISINTDKKTPLYQQLYIQIRQKIISGEYPEGTHLTSTRKLAMDLCVGRNTVESAYDQLCVEGYVESKQGSGFTVVDLADNLLEFPGVINKSSKNCAVNAKDNVQEETFACQSKPSYRYQFRYGAMDYRTFPHAEWRKVTAKVLAHADPETLYSYGDKQGELVLRREINNYLRQSRGVRCNPDQIILGSGFQDLMRMICLLLKENQPTLAMEEPGYDFTRIIFSDHGYDIVPVRVNGCGMDPDELEECGSSLAYVTPSHQLPMGVVMPIQQRMKLLQWARKVNGIIVEDDYDSELRYRTRPIPSLQSIDCDERVIYVGTFSKAFSPGLRMGYMVLPPWLLNDYHRIFARYKSNVPRCQQVVAAEFMSSGRWEKHLRRICLINRKKRDVLIQTIHEEMGGKVQIHGQNAGLHVLLEFLHGEDQLLMVERAAKHQVMVSPTHQFWHNQENTINNLIMLGFGGLSEKEIIEGVSLLRQAWFD